MPWTKKFYKDTETWMKGLPQWYREDFGPDPLDPGNYTLVPSGGGPRAHRSIFSCVTKRGEFKRWVWVACYRINADGSFTRIGWHWKGMCPQARKGVEW